MKKFYSLLLALFIVSTATAQLQTQIISAGVFKITYGATNDYSFYDPGFEVPTFYVHCFVNAAENTAGTAFEDAWSNSTVTMNWDNTAMAYVGTIDLNTKTFTQTNARIPVGTTVNKIGMVFKDLQNGANKQSADFYANGPTTIIALGVSNSSVKAKSTVIKGQLRTALTGNLSLEIYEMSGKLVNSFKANSNENAIDLNISKTGIYLVKVSDGTTNEIVKFAK
jgi:hypothetical protein